MAASIRYPGIVMQPATPRNCIFARRLFASLMVVAMCWPSAAQPASLQSETYDWGQATPLHTGIDHVELRLTSPSSLVVNCLRIDTLAPGIGFTTTERVDAWQVGVRETARQTTPDFLTRSQASAEPVVAAVNANLFVTNGSAADLTGFAVSKGVLVSTGVQSGVGKASFAVSNSGVPSVRTTMNATSPGDAWTAVSGIYQCLAGGVPRLRGTDRQPRTGLGVSAGSRFVYMLTIDGRSASSVGATNTEVGEWLAFFGAYDGLYMDGGGSTTMAWWDPSAGTNGRAEVLNTPSDGSPRSVGNNIGVTLSTPIFIESELWWAGDAVRGGSGTWAPGTVNWRRGAIYGEDVAWNSQGTTAVFSGPPGVVTVSPGVTVESLDIRTSGYRIGLSDQDNSLTITGSPTIDVVAGSATQLSARLAGSGPRLRGGDGSAESLLILDPAGSSALTGTTTLGNRLLVELRSSGALGDSTIAIEPGSGLDLNLASGHFTNDLMLSGSGPQSTGAAVRLTSSTDITGAIFLENDSTFRFGTLAAVTAALSGPIDGRGGLTLLSDNGSQVTIANANTYRGDTTIDMSAGGVRLGESSHASAETLLSGPLGTGVVRFRSGSLSASDATSPRHLANPVITSAAVTLGHESMSAPLLLTGGVHLIDSLALTVASEVTLSGPLTCAEPTTSLAKDGQGTLVLDGPTSHRGGTSILAGQLTLTDRATLAGNVVLEGTLAVDRDADFTLSGLITGRGRLLKQGSSSLLVSAANTFSGGTAVLDGEISLIRGRSLGPGPVTVHRGAQLTMLFQSTLTTSALTLEGGAFHAGEVLVDASEAGIGSLVIDDGVLVGEPALIVRNAGTAHISSSTTKPLQLSKLTVDSSPGGGLLDIGNASLSITAATAPAPSTDLSAAILAGRGDGSWNGTFGIRSAQAAADPRLAVGYFEDSSSLTLRTTLVGDATFDNAVNFDDILAMFPNYSSRESSSGTFRWQDGDFTYDGIVDFDDVLALFPNYNATYPSAPFAVVPEPPGSAVSVTLVMLVASAVFRRRRRQTPASPLTPSMRRVSVPGSGTTATPPMPPPPKTLAFPPR